MPVMAVMPIDDASVRLSGTRLPKALANSWQGTLKIYLDKEARLPRRALGRRWSRAGVFPAGEPGVLGSAGRAAASPAGEPGVLGSAGRAAAFPAGEPGVLGSAGRAAAVRSTA